MSAERHEDQFPPPRTSARCGFRKKTIARTRRNGRHAPKLVIGAVRDRTAGLTQTRNFRVSRWVRKAILFGQHALGYRRGIGRNGIGFGPGRRARHMPARVLSSTTSPE